MDLKLDKPICFFDLETTGVNVSNDRIVEISVIKINIDKTEDSKTWLINPTIPIPKKVSVIHGITNEMVKDKPNFSELAIEISEFIKDCHLAGFNSNKFDVPMLIEEFLRADFDFDISSIELIDVQNIFHKMEKRTLSAAYKFYCGKIHENAHSSLSDAKATYEVFKSQLEKYSELEKNIKFLSNFSRMRRNLDLSGYILENEKGKPVFSFGKYKGNEVSEVLKNDPGYYSWIMKSDFPKYTKNILNKIRLSELNNKIS